MNQSNIDMTGGLLRLRHILERTGPSIRTVVILGSGMSNCFRDEEIELIHEVESGVQGHTGRLAVLQRPSGAVLVSLGRKHLYEGYTLHDVTGIVVAAYERGARRLLVTNAAGGLNPSYRVGEIMLIDDYISMPPGTMRHRPVAAHPRSVPYGGDVRSPACRRNDELYDRLTVCGLEQGVRLRRGVYVGVPGPSYETRAEIRMLRQLGADAVGMSTVPELAAAESLGMSTVGLSLITNVLSDAVRTPLDHADVVHHGAVAARMVRRAIDAALQAFDEDDLSEEERIPND